MNESEEFENKWLVGVSMGAPAEQVIASKLEELAHAHGNGSWPELSIWHGVKAASGNCIAISEVLFTCLEYLETRNTGNLNALRFASVLNKLQVYSPCTHIPYICTARDALLCVCEVRDSGILCLYC